MKTLQKNTLTLALLSATLLLSTQVGQVQAFGNTRLTATVLALNSAISGTIQPTGDVDYFVMTVVRSGTLTLFTTGNTDTTGRLENVAGTQLAFNDDGGTGTNFNIERDVIPGTYYIRVAGFGSNTGAYTLRVNYAPLDHGDNRSEATVLALNSATSGEIQPSGDDDYFVMTVVRSGTLTLFTTGNTDTTGRLENAAGTTLVSNDDGGVNANFNIERDVAPGTYYLRVAGFSNDTGAYTLQVNFASLDHGDTRSTATTIALNSTTTGTIQTSDDDDYFEVTVVRSGTLTLFTTGNTDVTGRLENAAGTQLASNDDGGTSRNFHIERDVVPGTYYIRVSGFGSNTGDYTLAVNYAPLDHGNSRSAATIIALNSATTGTIQTSSDVDYFVVTVANSGILTFFTTGNTDTTGRLENVLGTQLTSNDQSGTGDNFHIERDVIPGTYYIRVASFGSNTGDYTLQVNFAPLLCGRTAQVQAAIIAAISGNPACGAVTPTQLAAINPTGGLTINTLDSPGNTLSPGDFARLSGLEILNLTGNSQLTALPSGLFTDLDALTTLDLSGNPALTALPSGIFDELLDTLTALSLDPALMGSLAFASARGNIVPGDTTTLVVQLDRALPSTLRASYTTAFAEGANSAHIALSSNTLELPAGTTSTSLSITATAAATGTLTLGLTGLSLPYGNGGDENTLASAGLVAVGTPATQQLTLRPIATGIGDFQAAPTTLAEGSSTTLTLALNSPAGEEVTIPYNIGGTGITADDLEGPLSGTFVIPEGQISAVISIAARSDGLIEGTETLEVTLTPPAVGQRYGGVGFAAGDANAALNLTISNGDALVVSLADPGTRLTHEGVDFEIALELAQGSRLGQAMSVTYEVVASTQPLAQLQARLEQEQLAGLDADTVATATAADVRRYEGSALATVTFGQDYSLSRPDPFDATAANNRVSFRLQGYADDEDEESPEYFEVRIISVTTDGGGIQGTLSGVNRLGVVILPHDYRDYARVRRTADVKVASLALSEAQAGMVLDLLEQRMKARPDGGTDSAPRGLQLTRRPKDFDDLLHSLAFELQTGGGATRVDGGGGGLSLWARVAQRSLSGSPTLDDGHVFEYDGSATGIGLGLEWAFSEQLLAGVSLTMTDGELDTESGARPDETNDGTATGVYEESLTLVTPYLSLRLGERTRFWVAMGTTMDGEVTDRRTLEGAAGDARDGDERTAMASMDATLFAGGLEHKVVALQGSEIDLGLSVLSMEKTIDPLVYGFADGSAEGVTLDEISTELTQLKGHIKLGWPRQLAGGGQFKPYLRAQLVQDQGDTIGEDESGLELVGGIEYGSGRLSLSAEFGTELIREDREVQGLSAALKLNPASGGRGLSLNLSTQDKRMQSRDGLGDIGKAVGASEATGDGSLGREMGLEMGYGIGLGGIGGSTAESLLTPYLASRQDREGDVRQGAGLKLKLPGMAFTLENNRRQQDGGQASSQKSQSDEELRYGAEFALPGSPLRLTLKGTRDRTDGAGANTLGAEYRLLDDALRLKLETRLGAARTGWTNPKNQEDQGEKSSLTAELHF